MTNTFTNGSAFPVTLSQVQRIAQTLQKRIYPESAVHPEGTACGRAVFAASGESKVFSDRTGAGALLAAKLTKFSGREDVSVVGLSPAGMVVAAEVARQLQVSLHPWVVKKIHARLLFSATLGAVAEDGEMLVDEEAFQRLHVPPTLLVEEVRACRAEVKRRSELFRSIQPAAELAGQTVIMVDDGAASGFTIRAALLGLRRQRPARLILALPVISTALLREFNAAVEETLTLETTFETQPLPQRYVHYPAVSSDEVATLLQQATAAPVKMLTHTRAVDDRRAGIFR